MGESARPFIPLPTLWGDAMTQALLQSVNRRTILKAATSVASAFSLGLTIGSEAAQAEDRGPGLTPPPDPNAFILIGADSQVTVLVKFLDKGQGIATAMATLVAEELGVDWEQMHVRFAPADTKRYANLLYGIQGTGSSTSLRGSYLQMRMAGAAAREMLIAAAAQTWNVPKDQLRIEHGVVIHGPTDRRGPIGGFAQLAAGLPVPQAPQLKDSADFKIIGRDLLPRLDSVDKTSGQPIFGHDHRQPGMLFAVVAHPPRFGAKVASFSLPQASRTPDIVDVFSIERGVAVLARNSWAAIKARAALTISWNDDAAEKRGSKELEAEYRALAEKPGLVAVRKGDAQASPAGTDAVTAEYLFPYLAHAPMEPENVTIELREGGVKLTLGSQFQTVEQFAVSKVLGLKPENVELVTTWAGASFGRRANPAADFVVEAALIAKQFGQKNQPIQLLFTREDDIRGGYYRPMAFHRIAASLDAQGRIKSWHQRIVGQSITEGTPFAQYLVKDGVDELCVEGASDMSYDVPNFMVEAHQPKVGVPVLWWRSVGHTHCVHAVESFMDELAQKAGRDPVDFRRAHLQGNPRLLRVLDAASEAIGWGRKLQPNEGLGIAVQSSYKSFVAHAAEVHVVNGKIEVRRIVCAIDCGVAVNPDIIRSQAEGGAIFATGAAMSGRITLTDGRVDQANFDTYESIRMSEAPKVDVIIIKSTEAPSGAGEPVVPSVAPAIANAVFQATGRRIRDLPFSRTALK